MPTIAVTGMGCDGCESILENAIGDVPGVESVEADREQGVVEYTGGPNDEAVVEAVEFAGYQVSDTDETEA